MPIMNAPAVVRRKFPNEHGQTEVTEFEPVPMPAHTRYADQPTSLRARLTGLGGTAGVALLICAGLLLTWTTYSAPPARPTISAFNVAPPAAPPEPVREVPPGPSRKRKEEPAPQAAEILPPSIVIAATEPLPAAPAVRPAPPDPAPPAREETAPVSRPLPPQPQASTGKPTWEGRVLAALDRVKRYPRDAHFARKQGVPYIRFSMDRQGKVLTVTLERSSGVRSLDNEALALPRRAQPLPRPPEDMKGEAIELVVPVEFFMR